MIGTAVNLGGFKMIPVDQIEANPANIRDSLGDLEELAASIRENGLVQPLIVYQLAPNRYRLLAGHRRHEAAFLAGLDQVPCVVRKEPDEAKALRLMLVENTQRSNLDPIEEAHALRRLMEATGGNQGDVARMIGKSPATVSLRLSLLRLNAHEQQAVRSRTMQVQEARVVVRQRSSHPSHTPGWWLSKQHPLAGLVTATCSANAHSGARKVGNVGCGECWEQVIRDNERTRLAAE